MLTNPELLQLIHHENLQISDKAIEVLRLLNLAKLERSQLEGLLKKESK